MTFVEIPDAVCRRKLAWWISLCFFLLMFFTLCFPQPQGVADNADMMRNSLLVAASPMGMTNLVPSSDRPAYVSRYFLYYIRYWKKTPLKVVALTENFESSFRAAAISSNLPLFLPAYFLPLTTPKGSYDLTLNTFYLLMILACFLHFTLRAWNFRSSPLLMVSMLACMLVLCDSGSARLLNSFYQDCGTFFYFFMLVVFAHVLWSHPTRRMCCIFLLLCLLLMLSKATNTISGLISFGLLPFVAIYRSESIIRKKSAALAILFFFVGTFSICGYLMGNTNSPQALNRNFFFNTALPHLPAEQRPGYLQRLGMNPALSQYSGLTTGSLPEKAGIDAQFPNPPRYGRKLHLRSILVMLCHYPRSFAGIFRDAVTLTGHGYNGFGSREQSYSSTSIPSSGYVLWCKLRQHYLHGWWSYFVSMGMGLTLVIIAIRRRDTGQLLFLAIMVNSFILASFSNIALSAYGDWFGDLARHIYFGNLLFDVQFVMGVIGAAYVLWPRPRKRRNPNPSAIA